jgi:hypothetical protein
MRTLLRKGMELTIDFEETRIPQPKQNKGFGLQNSQNKHMIEISSEIFVVRPARARSYSGHHDKVVYMTTKRPRIVAKLQGLFKTQ